MNPIRVLIVDDSAFVRKVVRGMLTSSPDIEVVGFARNGEDALTAVEELNPDVVTCDLVMPVLDGVSFVQRQMATKPVPILILTASPQDGELVLEALQAGAVDFVQKPSALANDDLLTIRDELIATVKAASQSTVRRSSPPVVAPVPVPMDSAPTAAEVDIVVIGTSTGGPQALRFLVPQFAADFPVPIVMVLHMPVGYTAMFAEKLAELSRILVKEAYQGCEVRAGQVLLAPAGKHLTFKRSSKTLVTVHLLPDSREKPHCPSVDILFASASETYGKRVLGVVLTGMGDDGMAGAASIKAQGGKVLTESAESCTIYGMPRCVVESGMSDAALPLTSMAREINRRI